jgi:TolB-like protein
VAVGCIGLLVALALFHSEREARLDADAPPPPLTRLLVLPFDTSEATGIGRDVGVEMADEIADSLVQVERLQISGHTSADTLAAMHTVAVEAGRKLGVDAVLSGEVAVRPAGLRVTSPR